MLARPQESVLRRRRIASVANPDWIAITFSGYRSRFLADEPRDPRYDTMAYRLAEVETIAIPTLMIQGGDDRCDFPASSANQERFFVAGYRRVLLDGVGHFPHREAPHKVAHAIDQHLAAKVG